MKEVKLFRKTSLGVSTWRIWPEGNTVYYGHCMVEGGAEQVHSEEVKLNQSGRSMEEQIHLEMKSRISRQLDKGYKPTRAEALEGSTNQLGLINPMLAKPIEDVPNVSFANTFIQPKLDGHRCLITRQDGEIIAYTRKGKLIDTIPHILEDIAHWLPEGYTLDGELYIHGQKLQTISSLIKRKQPGSANLQYHFYDIVANEPFHERLFEMKQLVTNVKTPQISLVETHRILGTQEVKFWFSHYRSVGLEGAIVRVAGRGYEDAKRSAQLLKVKSWIEEEVTVQSIRASKDGWAICRVKTDSDRVFDISAPGSIPEKTAVLRNSHLFIGKRLTIEYASLTEDGIPFHAAALRWRDDL